MDDGSSGATALLGMDGFVVLASIEEAGELFISVETSADVVGCANCGVRAVGHGRSVVQVRDQPVGGRPSGWSGGSADGCVGIRIARPGASPRPATRSRAH